MEGEHAFVDSSLGGPGSVVTIVSSKEAPVKTGSLIRSNRDNPGRRWWDIIGIGILVGIMVVSIGALIGDVLVGPESCRGFLVVDLAKLIEPLDVGRVGGGDVVPVGGKKDAEDMTGSDGHLETAGSEA